MERRPNKWIDKAIKHPGALRESLHVKEGDKIPEAKLDKALKSKNPTTVKRANMSKTLRGLRK